MGSANGHLTKSADRVCGSKATHTIQTQYTHIVIAMFAGRSLSAKRALYQAIVRHLEPFGVPPGDVRIILHEVPRENVGMQGGKAAIDLELGYEVRV